MRRPYAGDPAPCRHLPSRWVIGPAYHRSDLFSRPTVGSEQSFTDEGGLPAHSMISQTVGGQVFVGAQYDATPSSCRVRRRADLQSPLRDSCHQFTRGSDRVARK